MKYHWIGQFENDVEMYGAQTQWDIISSIIMFENDVEMYGAQTRAFFQLRHCSV